MSEEKKKKGFQPGNSLGNRNGAPPGPRLKRSKLRKTEEKLLAMQDLAFENLDKSLKGEEIDKERVSTSRWVVNTLATISKSALAEEVTINNLRIGLKDGENEDQEDKDEEPVTRFSLQMLPTPKDLQ